MSTTKAIGDNDKSVVSVTESISYIWIIKNFSKLSKDYKFQLCSPDFPESKQASQWKMNFYPNGNSDLKYCAIFLSPVNCAEKESICVKELSFTILDSEGKSVITNKTYSDRTFTKPINSYGYPEFCEISEMKKYIYNDELQIKATVQVKLFEMNSQHEIEGKNVNSIMKLTKDLESTLNTSDFSDFIIKVDGAEIAVHRNILASRSPVFSAMLKNDTSEKKSDFVKITDIDKNTMSSLIRFMYTTEVNFSTTEEPQNLFIAADKYELMDLKDLCEHYLIDNINLFNAIDVLIFSERYNAFTLKTKIIEYVILNMQYFKAAKRLQKLLEEPPLLLELLEKS